MGTAVTVARRGLVGDVSCDGVFVVTGTVVTEAEQWQVGSGVDGGGDHWLYRPSKNNIVLVEYFLKFLMALSRRYTMKNNFTILQKKFTLLRK